MNTGALIKELRAVFTICFSILGLSNLLPKKTGRCPSGMSERNDNGHPRKKENK